MKVIRCIPRSTIILKIVWRWPQPARQPTRLPHKEFSKITGRGNHRTHCAEQVHLDNFAGFLARIGAGVGDLAEDPEAWAGVTWGLEAAWQRWLLKDGYAISTINLSLTTIRTYANLAQKAGARIPPGSGHDPGCPRLHPRRSQTDR